MLPLLALQVEPQALQHDREERFNLPLFRRTGELGLLGVTAPEEYGGSGMDATGVCAAASLIGLLSTHTRPTGVCERLRPKA